MRSCGAHPVQPAAVTRAAPSAEVGISASVDGGSTRKTSRGAEGPRRARPGRKKARPSARIRRADAAAPCSRGAPFFFRRARAVTYINAVFLTQGAHRRGARVMYPVKSVESLFSPLAGLMRPLTSEQEVTVVARRGRRLTLG